MAKVVSGVVNKQVFYIQPTSLLVKEPVDVFCVGKPVQVTMGYGHLHVNLAQVVLGWSRSSVFNVVTGEAEIVSLELAGPDDLGVVHEVSPAAPRWSMHEFDGKPGHIVNGTVVVSVALINDIAKVWRKLAEGGKSVHRIETILVDVIQSGHFDGCGDTLVILSSIPERRAFILGEPGNRREANEKIHSLIIHFWFHRCTNEELGGSL